MKSKLLFVVNVDSFFISHRLPIALKAMQNGYEVHIATSITCHGSKLQNLGLKVHNLKLDRRSIGIFSNFYIFLQLIKLFKKIQPDIIHLVTIKPVIWGGLAARFLSAPRVVVSISGMGFIFIAKSIKANLIRKLVGFLYKHALQHRKLKVICQNTNDLNIISTLVNLKPENFILIKGSGVDLNLYKPNPLPKCVPIVMLAARLLVDKGIREFVKASQTLKSEKNNARFVLVGDPDFGNPATITQEELNNWVKNGIIEHWGHRADMPDVLAQAYMIILPSYREGLPKVLCEAAACAKAVVTTDAPGCADAIMPGKTGIIVKTADVNSLVLAIKKLLENPELCANMGNAGRKLAEKEFDIREVIAKHMQIYKQLL